MSVTAVVGAQWGDEGKGRVVDLLAQDSQLVVRFQGGNNAGHTVVNEFGTFRLHHVPSGIFNPDCWNVISAGCVVNPGDLLTEMAEIASGGGNCDKLLISERAHVVMPYHLLLDGLDEAQRSTAGNAIGTTKKGIGPCYTDKFARVGLQMGDLLDRTWLSQKVATLVAAKNVVIQQIYQAEPLQAEEVFETLWEQTQQLQPLVRDTLPLVHGALRQNQRILLEGQLGALRDIDWGTYPYVTSSSPTAGGAASGAGIPPHRITHVVGVAKAYTTAVGAGPFPAELHDAVGEQLRAVGQEYGATTGRPRRCGWFDALAVRHAAMLNGFTAIALTKLDVLDALDEIRICTGYRVGDQVFDHVPTTRLLEQVKPILETHPGWHQPTNTARDFLELPVEAQRYVERLEALVGVPIEWVSVGAERSEMVVRG
ncbi:MAG: adenylosuccinate synthase [Fimbriimonadaceae bacterium]|nr:adenylosuccinate synthase [Fimbriimonadaceae bacterium]